MSHYHTNHTIIFLAFSSSPHRTALTGLNLPEDCEQVMQMYATHCTDDLRGYSWCVLNYSLRSPVTRRSFCTHVNPPPHLYLCLFCLRHVSSVQKFPRAERVSLPPLLTVVVGVVLKEFFMDALWFDAFLNVLQRREGKNQNS